MGQTVAVLNGPNLNLLGTRQPHIYGRDTLTDVEALCRDRSASLGLTLWFEQSNAEHQLIDWVQRAREVAVGIVINPAGYGHTSIALLDALMAFEGPVFEVHISNIHQRESFRHHSYVSVRADGVIAGCGIAGYGYALASVAARLGVTSPPPGPG